MPRQNLAVSPYYDDYNKDKKFTRLLARPGYAEQAREFTQIQTMMLYYLSRLGNTMLKNGAIIEGCTAESDGTTVTLTAGLVFVDGIIQPIVAASLAIT